MEFGKCESCDNTPAIIDYKYAVLGDLLTSEAGMADLAVGAVTCD